MAYREGRMVIIVDDEDRENEGDFAMAADAVTPEAINFMASVGRGLICCSMEGDRLDQLDLPPMVQRNTARLGTAFTVSVDASENITGHEPFRYSSTKSPPPTIWRGPATSSRCDTPRAASSCGRARQRRR